MPTLSLVIPATDDPATLPACLAAVGRAVDRPDEVLVIAEPATASACDARNEGSRRANGDVLVFVDADVEVHEDAFRRIRAAFAADPDLTALHGSYDDRPAARSTVSAFRNLLHHHVHHAHGGPAESFWSGLGAVRRSAFLAVGGFDADRYPHPSIEDIELGARLLAAGGRLRIDPTVQGTHLKRWTLRSMVWTDFARRGVPWVALQVRTRRLARTLNMGWAHRASAALCVALPLLLALRSPLFAGMCALGLAALNRGLYTLLLHRLGPVRGLGGVVLHWIHLLVAVAAVPVGILAGVRDARTSARRAVPADGERLSPRTMPS